LISQYLTSVAWSGAISSEDVVNLAARRVEKVALVPVEQIRFRYNKDLDIYEPYQKSNNLLRSNAANSLGLIKLNPETYQYYALSTVENSPYAKPPATAAVEAILQGQIPIMENIRWMAQKISLLGLIDVNVTPPAKRVGNETDDEARVRASSYIGRIAKKYMENFRQGILIHYNDQKIGHTPVTAGASGVEELNKISEQQVFSGMGAQPGFHGRTDSTTETFADVVYYLLTAQAAGMQRITKRRVERTYRLDLNLGGIPVDGVSLAFNKAHSRNAKEEAETAKIQLDTALEKIRSGAISPDEGAQELGLDSWFDPTLLAAGIPQQATPSLWAARSFQDKQTKTITLAFNKDRQRYIHQPERTEIWSGEGEIEAADNVTPFIKKKAHRA